MTTARDVADVFETIAPLSSGLPDDELGFQKGDPEKEIHGVACLWNVDIHSIQACVDQGLDMIICHEHMWLPPQRSLWYEGPAEADIIPNRLRRELLDRHEIVVYRSHSNWDALPEDGVPDQAVAVLGIEGLREVARQRFFSVQELPEPWEVQRLRARVAQALLYPDCRIFGDPLKPVRRFAFLIGGFGENQWNMPQAAYEMGAEALIIGEMSEFIVIGALEMGMPVIESLHSVSEIPAIRRQAQLLGEKLPDIPVCYVPSGARAFSEGVAT